MAGKKVSVVARFKAKAGMEEVLKKELLGLIQPSRSDEGCINYDLHQAIDDPGVFVFYENWESKELLDRHLQQEHLKAFLNKAEKLLAEQPQIILLHMIS